MIEWVMKGHAFLAEPFTAKLCAYLEEAMRKEASENLFWEDLFILHRQELVLYQKKFEDQKICEFDSLEELRALIRSTWIRRDLRSWRIWRISYNVRRERSGRFIRSNKEIRSWGSNLIAVV